MILPRPYLNAFFGGPDLSRRAFLQRAAAGAALLLSHGVQAAPKRPARGRIVIIGAGLAGLSCAYELMHAGFDVRVLEARARLGGRVRTLQAKRGTQSTQVEAGGELIGVQHALWGTYARRFGLHLVQRAEPADAGCIVVDGQRLDAGEVAELAPEVARACHALGEAARGIDPKKPWAHANAAQLDARDMGDFLRALNLAPRAHRHFETFMSGLSAVPVTRQSLLAQLAVIAGGGFDAYWTDSERLRCTEGNQALAERLAKEVGTARITLGAPVAAIERGADGVTVRCTDQGVHRGDAVVLAAPPSLWHALHMTPALPDALQLQMGDAFKRTHVPDAPFWGEHGVTSGDGAISSTWTNVDDRALVCFSGGPAAAVARAGGDAYERALRQHFPKAPPPAQRTIMDFDWRAEPYTQASYAAPAPGEVTRVGPLLHTSQQHLYFAGEHTWYPFCGYMEGALQSGAAVAARIANS